MYIIMDSFIKITLILLFIHTKSSTFITITAIFLLLISDWFLLSLGINYLMWGSITDNYYALIKMEDHYLLGKI